MIRVLRSLITHLMEARTSPAGDNPPASCDKPDTLAWLRPPSDTRDPLAWDRYWSEQVGHGLAPPLFDMFCDDKYLVEVMAHRGMTRVLCAGNGISQEPRALAEAGFHVVALDLSPLAARLAQAWKPQPGELERFFEPTHRRPGGTVAHVVGSILDASLCPGPFDVIVERRTLQLYPTGQRQVALEALVNRLAPEGIFCSHCHDNKWRPPAAPFHATETLLRNSGWSIVRKRQPEMPTGRFALLFQSTG